ncbi:MAG: polysaccharide biosynthesis tyrosine autokinase [Alphaproteobacteria bacterium]|nr:polysaccharide biosynthesis tyrosine autokinase [Alphaproteobacteria bacterium]
MQGGNATKEQHIMADTGGTRPALPLMSAQQDPNDELGLGHLIDVFRRRIWVFAGVAGFVLLLVAASTFTATKLYTAVAQIQIEVRESRVLADVESVVSGVGGDSSAVETETQVLQSRALAGRVVDHLQLTADPAFSPPPRPGMLARIAGALGAKPRQTAAEAAIAQTRAREVAISSLLNSTRITRLGLTYIIEIAVTLPEPDKAARIANAYAELYLTQQLETKYDTIARANEWLSKRLTDLRAEVLGKEREVEIYRTQSGLLSAAGSTLTEQAIASLNLELVQSRAALAERTARLRGVENAVAAGGSPESAAEALSSPVIGQLRERQADLARERAELSTKLGPKHPDMQRIAKEQADLEMQLQRQIRLIVDNLRNEAAIARQRVVSIEGSLAGQRTNLSQNNLGAVKLGELEREAEASRTLYEAFLNRFKQIAEQSGIEQPDARIQSRAGIPLGPSSPNTTLNLAIGVVLGLALGAVAVFLIELLERGLRTADDVTRRLGVPYLGAVPFLDKTTRIVDGELVAAENYVLKRPVSAFGEALRNIRAGVFFANPDRSLKVLAITSSVPDEGKTTTSLGLARISALAGSRTVLVDCDLRRRSATHALGLDVEKGLTEVLFKTATLQDVIRKDPGSGADVVPLAQAEFTPRDLFGSEAMRQLIETLRSKYDVVILDTAPVLPLADTRVLAALADSVLVVARWGRTPANLVKEAIDQLRQHNARVGGVVLEAVSTSLLARLFYDKSDYYGELYQTYYIR